MSRKKQVKSPEAGERLSQKDKKRFFRRKSKKQETIDDIEHLRRWARRIQGWIDRVEGRLRKMEGLPIVLQDAERDNALVNPYVTMLYEPSPDEISALVHLGIRFPIATQQVQGFLINADTWYARLSEGPTAGENLMNALDELLQTILACVKGIEGSGDERIGKPVSDNAGSEVARDSCNWEVPWDEKNIDYLQSGEARTEFTKGKITAPYLSRNLGKIPFHYMRSPGKGVRVHLGEFRKWAKGNNLTDTEKSEIAEEWIAELEARTAAEREKKQHK